MSIPAVPEYLAQAARRAKPSPALRFGMLLPIWTCRADQEKQVRQRASKKSREGLEANDLLQQGMDHAITVLQQRPANPLPGLWEKDQDSARDSWKAICTLYPADDQRMKALAARQQALAAACPGSFSLSAKSIAPFTTGLGNEHPLENGFAFLNPYGLPYLAGSGVKGVLRRAAQELASGDWGGGEGWSTRPQYTVGSGENRMDLSIIDLLFGREPPDGDSLHFRGLLSFWDVIPLIAGKSLRVDVMTPHQTHYYQQKPGSGADSASPHDSGQPNPIKFLTIPPGAGFEFHVVCDETRLRRLGLESLGTAGDDGASQWQRLLRAAFEHAFDWLGFGAKTAVGYGAMQVDVRQQQQREQAAAAARRERELQSLSEAGRAIEEFKAYMQGRHRELRGGKAKANGPEHQKARALAKQALESSDWSAEERAAAAEALETWVPKLIKVEWKDERKKLKLAQLRDTAG